jgi:hypothetical protein
MGEEDKGHGGGGEIGVKGCAVEFKEIREMGQGRNTIEALGWGGWSKGVAVFRVWGFLGIFFRG